MTYKSLTELRKHFPPELQALTRYAVYGKKSLLIYGLFSYDDSAKIFVRQDGEMREFYEIMDMDTGEVLL